GGHGGHGGQPGPQTPQTQPADLNISHSLSLDLEDLVGDGKQKAILIKDDRGGTRSLTVKIPKGIRPGKKIKLKGQGKTGPGGRQGDLLLEVHVNKHPSYTLNNNQLIYDLLLPPSTMLLGGKADIPTFDGSVTMTIPGPSKPDQKLRVKGHGLNEADGSRGDLLVRLKLAVPDQLTEDQKAALGQLKDTGL
ncbi:MAG: J domain-containing protein, partial [Cyanobacteria bacterium HKST-UBA06]|nr:J domain-containing protein [Cyanobacteria bacterium HKST-UBA06]